MKPLPWTSRKQTARVVLHSDVLRILQSKPPLPSMPRMEPKMSRAFGATATPNEACYLVGTSYLRARINSNSQVQGLLHPASQSFRVAELAFALGAYRLALRDEELTEDAVYQEARKVMPEIAAQVGEMEGARGSNA